MTQWNELADVFGGTWKEDTIPECAADNICIAWPSIFDCLAKIVNASSRLSALDFGCGGGLFCRELNRMGFDTTGFDESEELIKAARDNTPDDVVITSSGSVLKQRGRYDIISAVMVLQFIRDVDPIIDTLIALLNEHGVIVIAVFNRKFIEDNSNNSKVFSNFETYKTGWMELKEGVKIPVYNRMASEYRKIFANKGFEEVYIDYPPFTQEFLDKYNMPFSTKEPEYLIQAFRQKKVEHDVFDTDLRI